MSVLEKIAVIFIAVLQIVGAFLLLSPAAREEIQRFIAVIFPRTNDTPEQAHEYNPCETCQRWGECNGVDRENCPLWRTDKQEVQHGKTE